MIQVVSKLNKTPARLVAFWMASGAIVSLLAALVLKGWLLPAGAQVGLRALFLFHFACFGLITALPLWHLRSTHRRLETLHETATSLARGDMAAMREVEGSDEIARLSEALAEVARYQEELTTCAQRMAQGNLLRDPVARSEVDRFGQSLGTLVKKLRLMVGALETNCQTV